jgi:6-phosphofructokinase 1
LGSCRYKLPDLSENAEIYKTITDCFDRHDIKAFFYIGGNDSMDTVNKLSKYYKQIGKDIKVIGVPKTIDNDLCETDHTPGFGSAAKYVATSVQEIARDSSVYSIKSVTIVEVMGRHAGYLAMYVGLAVGATAVLVPEKEIDFELDVIEKIRQARFNGFTHYMIVVAEGAGSASEIAAKIKDAIDLDPRVTVLGHIQRGGVPTGRDRVNATKMGYLAVELLLDGKTNRIVCTHDGGYTDIDMDIGLDAKKSIQQMEVDVLAAMTGI